MGPNYEEDTEWNDVLREKGIIPAKPKGDAEITEERLMEMVDKAIAEQQYGKAIEDRELDELDELEDVEDDEVLAAYRAQRIAEMKATQSKEVYSTLRQISKPDYEKEVTLASRTCWVIVCMYQEHLPDCKLLCAILSRLAVSAHLRSNCILL